MEITKGKWSKAPNNHVYRRNYKELYEFGGHVAGERPIALANGTNFYTNEEITANMILIAEAGTVANETNLTPRELLEQRDELYQALKEFYDSYIIKIYDDSEDAMNIELGNAKDILNKIKL